MKTINRTPSSRSAKRYFVKVLDATKEPEHSPLTEIRADDEYIDRHREPYKTRYYWPRKTSITELTFLLVSSVKQALREVALKTGLNIVASSGPYLEKFESQRIHKTVDELATTIDKESNQGIGDTDIRAGMIGEIGVSPTFTEAEHNSLRAASLAQINNPHVAMNIHMPGWLRRGDEVLDIVLGEMGVSPNKVSLAHSDPSGKDVAYQRKMLDKGVWLEFDMIGLDITFPKEGIAPGVQETADAVAHLIELGYADQLVLSHDVFLKQMWAKNGGNGWGFVPDVFLAYLAERGVDKTILKKLCIDNPGRLLTA